AKPVQRRFAILEQFGEALVRPVFFASAFGVRGAFAPLLTPRHLVFAEPVTETAHGFDRIAGFAQFFAQTTHVGVDSAGVDDAFVAPDVVAQFIAAMHAAPALDQGPQQFELEAGEMQPFAVNANLVARRIDRNRAGLERFLWFPPTPQNCPDSQHYFAR